MIAHSGPQGQKRGYFYISKSGELGTSFHYTNQIAVVTQVFYHHLENGTYDADDPSGYYLNTGKTKDYYGKVMTLMGVFAIYCLVCDYGLDDYVCI